MNFGHFNVMKKKCKNDLKLKSEIKLDKINISIILSSLSYVFLKVEENKVPLEF